MARQQTPPPTAESANALVTFLLDKGLGGFPPLSSAAALADEYLIDQGFKDDDQRVAALIKWETRKNFTTGFITGLGGFVSLPMGVPSALVASWLIQARMAGAIARIYGHDLADPRVRTMILLSLAGDVAKQAMADFGLNLGNKLRQTIAKQVPGRALVEINKRIGLKLIAQTTQRGLAQFPKAVPVLGGVVGGAFDAVVCRLVGRTARKLFAPVAEG
jgi:uncharacterized protein (DUF697 family)